MSACPPEGSGGGGTVIDSGTVSQGGSNADASASAGVGGGDAGEGGAGVAVEGGAGEASTLAPDAGPAVEDGGAICSSVWPQSGGLLVSHVLSAVDTAGNTYVALDYDNNRPLDDDASAPPQLNLGSPSPQFPAPGFAVAKFDDSCNLVWVREFGPSGAAYSIGVEADVIATDTASDVIILGDFFGSVDLGAGTLTSGPQIDNGVLLRLDETGKTVFSRQFVNTRSGSSTTLYSLA